VEVVAEFLEKSQYIVSSDNRGLACRTKKVLHSSNCFKLVKHLQINGLSMKLVCRFQALSKIVQNRFLLLNLVGDFS
jgi:hypothetical protein